MAIKNQTKMEAFLQFFCHTQKVSLQDTATPLPDAWMCDTRAISTFITSIQYK
jgi:hypothetical protein